MIFYFLPTLMFFPFESFLEIFFFSDFFLLFDTNDHQTTGVYDQNSKIGLPLLDLKAKF